MRIQLLSDLHFEFHADSGRCFVESLDPEGVDALVLAGDIAVGDDIALALDLLCARYRDATVVYVHGNHEFYGAPREAVVAVTRDVVSRHENLVWLDADVAVIDTRRFLGAPLWFPRAPEADAVKHHMTDFSVIPGFETWVYDENARALAMFESELREGDIVVTHHLPTPRSVAPRYRGHPLNPFFVCDVEPLIRDRKPALWLHGHTHETVRYQIGPTRIASNPFGYATYELNKRFTEHAYFDV